MSEAAAAVNSAIDNGIKASDETRLTQDVVLYIAVPSEAGARVWRYDWDPQQGTLERSTWSVLLGGAEVGLQRGVHRERQRLLSFEHQLPDTLTLLASSLRAGFSLMQENLGFAIAAAVALLDLLPALGGVIWIKHPGHGRRSDMTSGHDTTIAVGAPRDRIGKRPPYG